MTNSELIANYESIKADYIAANKEMIIAIDAMALRWAGKIEQNTGAKMAIRSTNRDEYIALMMIDNDGDRHDIDLYFNRPYYPDASRVLTINPPTIGSFSCHDDYQSKFFLVIGEMVKNLANWEKELYSLDWKSFEAKYDLFYAASNAVEKAERDARPAAEEAKRADIRAKLVSGAKLVRKGHVWEITKVTPKFVKYNYGSIRKEWLVSDIMAGEIEVR